MLHSAEEQANLATVERYFQLINAGAMDDSFAECVAPDVVQEEYPNRLLPNGARRDLAGLREASNRGRALMARQHFDGQRIYASGPTVIVESVWSGTVGVDAGPFKTGTELRAHFAQFFELRGARIPAIRNYDCFLPW